MKCHSVHAACMHRPTRRLGAPHNYNCIPHWRPADEPVQPYEALDDGARALIEAIQERQAYIAEGEERPCWEHERTALLSTEEAGCACTPCQSPIPEAPFSLSTPVCCNQCNLQA